jgi:DNA-damage-inducible protein J
VAAKTTQDQTTTLAGVPNKTWKTTVRRAKFLARLAEAERASVEQVKDVAQKLRLSRASVYRLLARFKNSREATSILPGAPGRKNGAKELSVDQEKIIDELIDKFYLSRQRPTVAALHRTIALECFQASIEVPSYKAVRSRVKSLDLSDVIRGREGAKGANQFRPVKASLTPNPVFDKVRHVRYNVSQRLNGMATTMVHVRVDEKVKQKATKTLAAMGMSVSDAVRMVLIRVAAEQALPFEVKVPNATTVKAMQAANRGKGKRFKTANALFKDLRI